MKKVLTLCIIHKHPQVLLGMKKRGFGAGRWNGFGGKVEPGETIEAAAKREIWEEAGIRVNNMDKVANVDFKFVGDPITLEVNVFRALDFEGNPVESDEMRPQWFHVDEIPFDQMWPDDKYWFPLFLEGKKFRARFVLKGQDKIIDHKIELI